MLSAQSGTSRSVSLTEGRLRVQIDCDAMNSRFEYVVPPSNFRRVTIAMRGHWGRSVVGESFGLRFEFNYDFCHRKLSVGWSH